MWRCSWLLVVFVLGCSSGRRAAGDASEPPIVTDTGGDAPQDGPADGPVSPAPGWSAIGVGYQYACGIHDGKLICWGDNSDGLVGVGSGSSYELGPTQLGADLWLTLASTQDETCAVRADHTMWCWGDTLTSGDPGVGHFAMAQVPGAWTSVSIRQRMICGVQTDHTLWCNGLSTAPGFTQRDGNAVQVSTGTEYECAIHVDGSLWCEGANSVGELGIGMISMATDFPLHVGAALWQSIAAGNGTTCGVTSDGKLRCWGREIYPTTSPTPYTTSPTPVLVGGEDRSDWSSVMIGVDSENACAVRTDGSMWCWGWNVRHAIAATDDAQILEPTQVSAAHAWSVGVPTYGEWCGIATDATLWCHGYDGYRQLGDLGTSAVAPRQVTGTFAAVATGATTTCAIRTDGSLGCAGSSQNGELGTGQLIEVPALGTVAGPTTWSEVSGGGDAFCAKASDASRWCWGGYPGISTVTSSSTPVQVQAWKLVAVNSHSCAIDANDHASCWGFEQYGEAGCPMDHTIPTAFDGTTTWTTLASGWGHTCGVSAAGTLCWGADFWHQLGDNGTTGGCTAAVVAGGHAFVALTTGWYHTCGLLGDGHAFCWGHNFRGALGIGTMIDAAVPAPLSTPQFLQLAAGEYHTCGIALDGTMWCWGDNTRGQLGDGTYQVHTAPVQVGSATHWRRVAAGEFHTCALNTANELWCWGANDRGQLADGVGWHDDLIQVVAP